MQTNVVMRNVLNGRFAIEPERRVFYWFQVSDAKAPIGDHVVELDLDHRGPQTATDHSDGTTFQAELLGHGTYEQARAAVIESD